MRRLTEKNKKHFLQRSKDELKKKSRRQFIIYRTKTTSYGQLVSLHAPPIFRLQYENVNEVISYINRVKEAGSSKKNIYIRLENVTDLGEGAIAMLLSVIEELSKKGVFIRGSYPLIKSARDVLEKSGFFNYVEGNVDTQNKITKNTIIKTGNISTSQVTLAYQIKKAMHTVWGKEGRNPLVYGSVFEMMRNSCDHAFSTESQVIWHFAISHEDKANKVYFSFVDNGKGIIRTLTGGILKRFINLFNSNVDLLETAFEGHIESRTGLSWRGKGLPTIFENYEEGYLKNLVVISNDVYIDFEKKIKARLKTSFSGTYYYWVVDTNCKKACFV